MIDNLWIKDFPQIKNNYIYLDSSATSLKPNSVIKSLNHYYNDLSSNIHRGMYYQAIEATKLYEDTRNVVAGFINALPKEIVYTRGTTSSINLVANSYGLNNLKKGDEIITSELEHHSNFLPWQNVAKKTGAKLKFIELNKEGRITIEAFKSVLTERTKIVALTLVSNIMGYINPIKEIIELAHKVNALVLVDGAQAIGHISIDVLDLDCDFFAFSGHKMCGPTGVGILYGKSKILDELEPFEYGGDMVNDADKTNSTWKKSPQKFEAGTMPIAEIIGLAEAVRYLKNIGMNTIHDYVNDIHTYAMSKLIEIEGLTIYNPGSQIGIISFNLDNVPSHDAITYFSEENIALRAGQHCAKLICDWLGIYSCLRASIYFYNTKEDIDKLINVIKEAIHYFKQLGF